MKNDEKIRDEKLQHNVNREAVKVSALSSGNIDKYEYLKGEEISSSSPSEIVQQAKFIYFFIGKAWNLSQNRTWAK